MKASTGLTHHPSSTNHMDPLLFNTNSELPNQHSPSSHMYLHEASTTMQKSPMQTRNTTGIGSNYGFGQVKETKSHWLHRPLTLNNSKSDANIIKQGFNENNQGRNSSVENLVHTPVITVDNGEKRKIIRIETMDTAKKRFHFQKSCKQFYLAKRLSSKNTQDQLDEQSMEQSSKYNINPEQLENEDTFFKNSEVVKKRKMKLLNQKSLQNFGSKKSHALEIQEQFGSQAPNLQSRQLIGTVEEFVNYEQQKQHARDLFRKNGRVIRIKLPANSKQNSMMDQSMINRRSSKLSSKSKDHPSHNEEHFSVANFSGASIKDSEKMKKQALMKRLSVLKAKIPITQEQLQSRIDMIQCRLNSNKEKLATVDNRVVYTSENGVLTLSNRLVESRQERSLSRHQKLIDQWSKQTHLSCSKLSRPSSESIFKKVEGHRARVEERELLDLGQDMREKFGDERGWKMSLKYNENRDSVVEYREKVGAIHQGIAYVIKEDRKRPVEIIRRNLNFEGLEEEDEGNEKEFDNLKNSKLVKQKFSQGKKQVSQFIPSYSCEKDLLTLKIKGKNVFLSEKQCLEQLAHQSTVPDSRGKPPIVPHSASKHTHGSVHGSNHASHTSHTNHGNNNRSSLGASYGAIYGSHGGFGSLHGPRRSRKDTGDSARGLAEEMFLWVSNHQHNEWGEGEPDSSQEIICQDYSLSKEKL